MHATKVFIIGGTGAQGIPVVKALTADGKYHVRIQTRDVENHRAQELAKLPNVELIEGTFTDVESVRKGYAGCDGAWINVNGFSTGEMDEVFWGFRLYELAREAGVKFYVFGNLDYGYKLGGYDPKYRCGHYDGKGRVAEWLLAQPRTEMGVAIFTTGPYMDMSIHAGTPMAPKVIDGVVTWKVPLGDGAVPHIALDDVGHYVRWLFDHPERANGMELAVATEHVHYADLAAAFTRVTGKPAQYVDTSLEDYWASVPIGEKIVFGKKKVGERGTMTIKENFTGFWNLWKNSGGNRGVIKRDYKLLDEILPNRIKSAEEWLSKQENLWERVQPENLKPVMKGGEESVGVF